VTSPVLVAYSAPTLTAKDFKLSPWRTTPGKFSRDKRKSQRSTFRRLRFEANEALRRTGKRPHVRVIHSDRKRFPPPKGTLGVIENIVFIMGK
jgi:hypothetical protein